jgi:NAD(P)-dependent dehydrogenase (short-subunit alcohol dehydrogenase family)
MASVLITGTSTGIGLATAVALGRAGHSVYAHYAQSSASARTRGEGCEGETSRQNLGDGRRLRQFGKNAIANIQKDAGHIDVLVNNAGVERNGSVEETALSEFRAVMKPITLGRCGACRRLCRRCVS